jgi:endonuclease YncB( thermonuclease family)
MFAIGVATGLLLASVAMAPLPPAMASASVLPASEIRHDRAFGIYTAELVRVIDGDTFEARVNIWPGIDVTTKVRLRGIDAPEMRARCAEEFSKAVTARDALMAIVAQGALGVSNVTLDKYGGRIVADASTRDTADISAALLAAGHVRAYQGRRRESWC